MSPLQFVHSLFLLSRCSVSSYFSACSSVLWVSRMLYCVSDSVDSPVGLICHSALSGICPGDVHIVSKILMNKLILEKANTPAYMIA